MIRRLFELGLRPFIWYSGCCILGSLSSYLRTRCGPYLRRVLLLMSVC